MYSSPLLSSWSSKYSEQGNILLIAIYCCQGTFYGARLFSLSQVAAILFPLGELVFGKMVARCTIKIAISLNGYISLKIAISLNGYISLLK